MGQTWREAREVYAKLVDLSSCWQRILAHLAPRPGERWVDLGCGGLCDYRLQALPCKYYGVDSSRAVVDEVNRLLSEETPQNVVSVIRADADGLPYDDRFFDLATCIGLLECHPLDYRLQVLNELRRVLKHNGRAAVTYPNPLHPKIQDTMQMEPFKSSGIVLEDLNVVERRLPEVGFDITDRFSHSMHMVYTISPHTEISFQLD